MLAQSAGRARVVLNQPVGGSAYSNFSVFSCHHIHDKMLITRPSCNLCYVGFEVLSALVMKSSTFSMQRGVVR
jgi:hypothetical protein